MIKMTVLKVEEMHCNKCVQRITDAMEAAKIDCTVSLENKTVTVNGCENCVKSAIAELDDLGFSAVIQ